MNSNPYTKDKVKPNPAPYDEAINRSTSKIQNISDASIASMQNQSAMAGSSQGVANAGRLSADTAAKAFETRDREISRVTSAGEMAKANYLTQFDARRQFLESGYEESKPNAFDYASSIFSGLTGSIPLLKSLNVFPSIFGNNQGGGKAVATGNTNYTYPPINLLNNQLGSNNQQNLNQQLAAPFQNDNPEFYKDPAFLFKNNFSLSPFIDYSSKIKKNNFSLPKFKL
mgnify:CR=1 FL=1